MTLPVRPVRADDCQLNWDWIDGQFEALDTRVDNIETLYSPLGFVAALPGGSQTDGREVIYEASDADDVYWHFKYDASEAEWVFIGGPPLTAYNSGSSGNIAAGGAYADGSNCPTITVPLTGSYLVTYDAYIQIATGAGNRVFVSPTLGAAASDNDALFLQNNAASEAAITSAAARTASYSASNIAKLQIKATGGIGVTARRRISILPIRVTA